MRFRLQSIPSRFHVVSLAWAVLLPPIVGSAVVIDLTAVKRDTFFLTLLVTVALAYLATLAAFLEVPRLTVALVGDGNDGSGRDFSAAALCASTLLGASAGAAFSYASPDYCALTLPWFKWHVFPTVLGFMVGAGFGLLWCLSFSVTRAVRANQPRPDHPDGAAGLAPAGTALLLLAVPPALGVSLLALATIWEQLRGPVWMSSVAGLVVAVSALVVLAVPPALGLRAALFTTRRGLADHHDALLTKIRLRAEGALEAEDTSKDEVEQHAAALALGAELAKRGDAVRLHLELRSVAAALLPFVIQAATSLLPVGADKGSKPSEAQTTCTIIIREAAQVRGSSTGLVPE